MQKRVNRIIEQIADHHNIPTEEVYNLFMAQFLLIKNTMQEAIPGEIDTFKSVRLHSIGIFYPNKEQIKKIEENTLTSKNKHTVNRVIYKTKFAKEHIKKMQKLDKEFKNKRKLDKEDGNSK